MDDDIANALDSMIAEPEDWYREPARTQLLEALSRDPDLTSNFTNTVHYDGNQWHGFTKIEDLAVELLMRAAHADGKEAIANVRQYCRHRRSRVPLSPTSPVPRIPLGGLETQWRPAPLT